MYVITVLWSVDSDTDIKKRQVFINLVNLSPSSQSVATLGGFTARPTVGMCYRHKIILYELQTQAAL